MEILPGKPFNVYILNITATPVKLQKFRIAANASTAPTVTIHVKVDEPHVLTDEC